MLLIKFKAGNVGSYNKQIIFEKSIYISKLFNDKQNPKQYDNENTTQIEFRQSFNANPLKDATANNSPSLTPRNNDISNNTSSFNNSNYTNNISKSSINDKYDIHLHEIHKEIFEDI